jgi:hypothetical protein
MQDDIYGRGMKDRVEAFKPEGSVAVPLLACAISTDKKEMAYVDTLAMQTKLGVRRRQGEESMSLRDSEIVKQRNIMGTSQIFSGGGPTKIAESALPYAVMGGRGPALLTPVAPPTWLKDGKTVVPLASGHDPMKPVQPVQGKQPKKIDISVPGSTFRPPVQEAPPPKLSEDVSHQFREELKVRQKLAAEVQARIDAYLPVPVTPEDWKKLAETQSVVDVVVPPGTVVSSEAKQAIEAARQRLAEIKAKIIPPVVDSARLEEVRVEPVIASPPPAAPVVKHEPIVVTPVLDQTARIQDLEAENSALIGIVARLAAENKALKAKK